MTSSIAWAWNKKYIWLNNFGCKQNLLMKFGQFSIVLYVGMHIWIKVLLTQLIWVWPTRYLAVGHTTIGGWWEQPSSSMTQKLGPLFLVLIYRPQKDGTLSWPAERGDRGICWYDFLEESNPDCSQSPTVVFPLCYSPTCNIVLIVWILRTYIYVLPKC